MATFAYGTFMIAGIHYRIQVAHSKKATKISRLSGNTTKAHHSPMKSQEVKKVNNTDVTKYILFYTKFYAQDTWPLVKNLPGRKGFQQFNCPVSNCHLTSNRTLLGSIKEFDAVMFNLFHYNMHKQDGNRYINELNIPGPSERSPHQRYILLMKDPPTNAVPKDKLPISKLTGIFNWTMTHRLDADIPSPYGIMREYNDTKPYHEAKYIRSWKEWRTFEKDLFKLTLQRRDEEFKKLAKRPKGIVWIVSHCDTFSKREEYVKELQKHIEVDIFGQCGQECGRGADDCIHTIDQNYKFYLALENNYCDYYVTEKFWRTLESTLIPIVRGRSHYEKLAPPRSYINANDFPSPEKLAKYLRHLMSNRDEYLSYFWWKDYYYPDLSSAQVWMPMCDLCRKLHDDSEPAKILEIKDLKTMIKCNNPE